MTTSIRCRSDPDVVVDVRPTAIGSVGCCFHGLMIGWLFDWLACLPGLFGWVVGLLHCLVSCLTDWLVGFFG